MAITITEPQVTAAIVAAIDGAVSGVVYNRTRFPEDSTDTNYKTLFVDASKNINVWFVRWTGMTDVRDEFNRLVSEKHRYEISFVYGYVDANQSETTFKAQFFLARNVIEASANNTNQSAAHFGFGSKLSHSGLTVPTDIGLGLTDFGPNKCHVLLARMEVDLYDC